MVTMFFFGTALVVISASAVITSRQVEETSAQESIASSIVQGIGELSYLSNEYLIYRESQHLARWRSRFGSFSSDVGRLRLDWPEQRALLRSIQMNQQRMKEVFDGVVSDADSSPDRALDPASVRVSWSRMAVQSQELASDASHLAQLLRAQADQLRRRNLVVVFAMMGAFGGYFLINHLIVQWRALKALAMLQAGTRVVGSGNLDFRFEEGRNDEIGDLSRAFNQMTISLKEVTASKADLEREIARRQEAEKQLQQLYKLEKEVSQKLEAETSRRAEFLRALVHELKTPLTPVLASSGLRDASYVNVP